MSQLLPQIRGKVINKIKPFENKITAIFIVWAVGVYLLSVIFLNMATYNNSALLFWGTCIIMFPVAIYIAFRQHVDDKSRWYTYAGASVLPALFLIFIGYFTCLKTIIRLFMVAFFIFLPLSQLGYSASMDHTVLKSRSFNSAKLDHVKPLIIKLD